ncbi:MAG: alpha/beta fold hydrolase [Deltaproteobacteria bacterium]|nr:alpha/beta fold hydrolase [Deltaproteobacteria bacterium]
MNPLLPKDQYIKAGEINTRYWSVGDQGSTVILIHGLGASAEIWMHNVDAIAEQHRVYVPDLAGFGRSDKPVSSFTPLDYAYFVDDFMKALNIEQVSLIGQSLGGGIALQYALQYSQKVNNLILADCAGFGKEIIWTLRLMSLPGIGELLSYPSRIGVSIFFKLAVSNHALITEDFIDIYYKLFTQPGSPEFLLKVVRMLVDGRGAREEVLSPIMESLHKIKRPTLIIWGEDDRVFPLKHAYYGKENIPNSQLYIMKQCGHIPNFEQSEDFNKVVLDFLAG